MPGSGERRNGGATSSRAQSNRRTVEIRVDPALRRHVPVTSLSGLAQPVRHKLRALVLVACLTTSAHASPEGSSPAEPFRLVWSSSADCGDAAAFSSELKSRTALRSAERDEHAITILVETFREREGVRGRLTLRKPTGELAVRDVPGATCQEVESAMVLIAALMFDPLAAGLSFSTQGGQPVEPRSLPAPFPRIVPDWTLRAEHRLIAQSAVAPRVVWGQAGRLVLTRQSHAWHPSLSLGAHFARSTTSVPAGSAELEWATAQLSLCPAGAQPSAQWDFRACAVFQLGRLRGSGFETASPASSSILWSAAGAQLESRVELLGPLWVGWEGALTFPLTREVFYLDPQQSLHRVPAWAGSFGVGVGLCFF